MLKSMYIYTLEENDVLVLKGEKETIVKASSKAKDILLRALTSPPTTGVNLPEYWSTRGEHQARGQNYTLVPLNSVDPVYQSIKRLVLETFETTLVGQGRDAKTLNHFWIHFKKIERIENSSVYKNYNFRRNEMSNFLRTSNKRNWPRIETLPGTNVPVNTTVISPELGEHFLDGINEVYVFHGAKYDCVRTICNEGLDFRLANEKSMLGRGVYGAEMSTKSDQYTDYKKYRTSGRDLQMFLIRMLLGNCFLSTDHRPPRYTRPPCCQCERHDCTHETTRYDSVHGQNGKIFREYVVYQNDQCYPEYLITYQRI